MSGIGDIFFRASLDDSRLAVDAKRAGDKAGKAAGTSFRREFSKMTAFKQGVAQGLGIGAFNLVGTAIQKLTGYLGDAADAYREDEASQAQLRASLQANIPAWNGNADAIESVLASRIKLGFSDDEQRASLTTLLSRTHDYTKALELQRVAMDLARFTGKDLNAATDLLGKAFSGQVGALRRAGIAVDANATSHEALLAVMKATSGQAEAFATTDLGRVVVAETKAGEASEKFGKAISKITTPLQELGTTVIESLAWGFDQFDQQMSNTTKAMEMLRAQGIEPTEEAVRALVSQMGEVTFKSGKVFRGSMRDSADATEDLADGVGMLEDEVSDATGPTSRLSDAVKELGQESNDTDTQIGYLADTISEELFGDAINAGHLAELRKTHDELVKQREEAKKGSRAYQILTGEIAQNNKELFDLQYTMAQDEGPDAVLSFLRKARERFGKNNTQIQTMIDKLSTLWSKIKRFQGITFAGGGLIFTGIPHYAEGGHYAAGVPRIVGENGPELDVPDHSGYIVPNPSVSMAGMPSGSTTNSWGGVTINGLSVDARGATNPTAVGSAVRQGIHDAMADVLRQQNARLPSGARS